MEKLMQGQVLQWIENRTVVKSPVSCESVNANNVDQSLACGESDKDDAPLLHCLLPSVPCRLHHTSFLESPSQRHRPSFTPTSSPSPSSPLSIIACFTSTLSSVQRHDFLVISIGYRSPPVHKTMGDESLSLLLLCRAR